MACSIAARPFLAGLDAEWISRTRQSLREKRVRALECLADVSLANGEHPMAAQLAREVVELETFRETGWQRLMQALARAGNRAEALRAYAQWRKVLRSAIERRLSRRHASRGSHRRGPPTSPRKATATRART